jgi:hypothetical protein
MEFTAQQLQNYYAGWVWAGSTVDAENLALVGTATPPRYWVSGLEGPVEDRVVVTLELAAVEGGLRWEIKLTRGHEETRVLETSPYPARYERAAKKFEDVVLWQQHWLQVPQCICGEGCESPWGCHSW